MKVVFDLDGTLADGTHREHFIKPPPDWSGDPKDYPKDWDAYFAACGDDTPMIAGGVLSDFIILGYQIEIWSGRGEGPATAEAPRGVNRKTTEVWLEQHFGIYIGPEVRAIRMRAHGDLTPDVELKRRWLNEARGTGWEPQLAFDDRDRVVAMWREEGIPCFQVAPGAF